MEFSFNFYDLIKEFNFGKKKCFNNNVFICIYLDILIDICDKIFFFKEIYEKDFFFKLLRVVFFFSWRLYFSFVVIYFKYYVF